MELSEKVAYIKGLAEGLELGRDSKEDKILHAIIDCLDEMAHQVDYINEDLNSVEESIDAISADLEDVEDNLYEDNIDDDDVETYQAVCPVCGADVYFDDDDVAYDSIVCPSCGQELEFDSEFSEDTES